MTGSWKLVDKMSEARKTTRSAFIRDALEAKIERERIQESELRHAAGYAKQPVAPGEFEVWLDEQDWSACPRLRHCQLPTKP